MLSIETTPGLFAHDKGLSKKWWYAVPYPSSFHWSKLIPRGHEPWRLRSAKRPQLVLCVGSVQTLTPESTRLRRKLYSQCGAENASAVCVWHQIAHASNGMVNGSDLMALYTQSTFCLCPPGDSYTRKAIFDSIISGCIPVVFYRESMAQYFWHIKKDQVIRIIGLSS